MPSRAYAGCAHPYVVSVTDGAFSMEPLDLLLGEQASAPSQGKVPAAPPRPCSGPSCSKAPAIPVFPATSAPAGSEQWGCLGFHADLEGPPSAAFAHDERPPYPSQLRPPIFHPPRRSRSAKTLG
jgi:hypothetical protein